MGGGGRVRQGWSQVGQLAGQAGHIRVGMMKFITIFFILDLLDFVFHSFDDQALSQDM